MPKSAAERFANLVGKSVVEGECWNWLGFTTVGGYGRMLGPSGRNVYAHRFSYEMSKGPVPDVMQIDHLCRNRRCVNPAHLDAVTQRTNILRGVGPTAVNAAKSECMLGHPLEGGNLVIDSTGGRQCRTCKLARQRAWYRRSVEVAGAA